MTDPVLQDLSSDVIYAKAGHVARVTLNRPDVLNAMNLRMHRDLARVWDDIEQDPQIRVAVLTGAGDRGFSVGQDLKELAARIDQGVAPSSFGSRGAAGWPRLTERRFSKPLIGRVNGYALGGGCELALCCDVLVADRRAMFGLPEARLGLIAGAGGVFRLPRQLPPRIAMGYLLTGRQFSAQRALDWGMVNDVVATDELDACVEGWVQDMLRCSPASLRAIKDAALASSGLSVEQAFAARYEWEERRLEGPDCQEGPRAFLQKRPPVWRS